MLHGNMAWWSTKCSAEHDRITPALLSAVASAGAVADKVVWVIKITMFTRPLDGVHSQLSKPHLVKRKDGRSAASDSAEFGSPEMKTKLIIPGSLGRLNPDWN